MVTFGWRRIQIRSNLGGKRRRVGDRSRVTTWCSSFRIIFGILVGTSCDDCAGSADFVNIVDPVGFLLRDELVQMPAEGRRSKGLVAVLACFVFDQWQFGAGWTRLIVRSF